MKKRISSLLVGGLAIIAGAYIECWAASTAVDLKYEEASKLAGKFKLKGMEKVQYFDSTNMDAAIQREVGQGGLSIQD